MPDPLPAHHQHNPNPAPPPTQSASFPSEKHTRSPDHTKPVHTPTINHPRYPYLIPLSRKISAKRQPTRTCESTHHQPTPATSKSTRRPAGRTGAAQRSHQWALVLVPVAPSLFINRDKSYAALRQIGPVRMASHAWRLLSGRCSGACRPGDVDWLLGWAGLGG